MIGNLDIGTMTPRELMEAVRIAVTARAITTTGTDTIPPSDDHDAWDRLENKLFKLVHDMEPTP